MPKRELTPEEVIERNKLQAHQSLEQEQRDREHPIDRSSILTELGSLTARPLRDTHRPHTLEQERKLTANAMVALTTWHRVHVLQADHDSPDAAAHQDHQTKQFLVGLIRLINIIRPKQSLLTCSVDEAWVRTALEQAYGGVWATSHVTGYSPFTGPEDIIATLKEYRP